MKSKTAAPSAICLTVEDFERQHVKPKAGRTLVVGSRVYATRTDRRLRYADVVGVDMAAGPGVDRVVDLEEPLPDDLGTFAHIDCISVLEHSRRPWLLAANLERLLEPGGTLYLQAPQVWRIHNFPNDYWRFNAEGVRSLFPAIEWRTLMQIHGGQEERLPSLWHDKRLFFCRSEICGFGALK